MSLKKIGLLAFAILVFAALFMAVLMAQKNRFPPQKPAPLVLAPIEGKLDIRSINDIRVGGRKILLCGVAFAKPQSMRALVTEAARRDYQGKVVTCRPVGAGTPCDGKTAAKFEGSVVVQCITIAGIDIAAEFSERGFVCDVPSQSAGHYKTCSKL